MNPWIDLPTVGPFVLPADQVLVASFNTRAGHRHAQPEFTRLWRATLVHEASPFPFHLLNPELSAPGSRWWRSKLRSVIDAVGLECTAHGVLCVEYFPYHSSAYSQATPRLPSQKYGFTRVRNAITQGAVVAVLRSLKRWCAVIPELCAYPRRYQLRNAQNVTVSPGNCPEGFEAIIDALRPDRQAR